MVAPQSQNSHELPQKRTCQQPPIRGYMLYFGDICSVVRRFWLN